MSIKPEAGAYLEIQREKRQQEQQEQQKQQKQQAAQQAQAQAQPPPSPSPSKSFDEDLFYQRMAEAAAKNTERYFSPVGWTDPTTGKTYSKYGMEAQPRPPSSYPVNVVVSPESKVQAIENAQKIVEKTGGSVIVPVPLDFKLPEPVAVSGPSSKGYMMISPSATVQDVLMAQAKYPGASLYIYEPKSKERLLFTDEGLKIITPIETAPKFSGLGKPEIAGAAVGNEIIPSMQSGTKAVKLQEPAYIVEPQSIETKMPIDASGWKVPEVKPGDGFTGLPTHSTAVVGMEPKGEPLSTWLAKQGPLGQLAGGAFSAIESMVTPTPAAGAVPWEYLWTGKSESVEYLSKNRLYFTASLVAEAALFFTPTIIGKATKFLKGLEYGEEAVRVAAFAEVPTKTVRVTEIVEKPYSTIGIRATEETVTGRLKQVGEAGYVPRSYLETPSVNINVEGVKKVLTAEKGAAEASVVLRGVGEVEAVTPELKSMQALKISLNDNLRSVEQFADTYGGRVRKWFKSESVTISEYEREIKDIPSVISDELGYPKSIKAPAKPFEVEKPEVKLPTKAELAPKPTEVKPSTSTPIVSAIEKQEVRQTSPKVTILPIGEARIVEGAVGESIIKLGQAFAVSAPTRLQPAKERLAIGQYPSTIAAIIPKIGEGQSQSLRVQPVQPSLLSNIVKLNQQQYTAPRSIPEVSQRVTPILAPRLSTPQMPRQNLVPVTSQRTTTVPRITTIATTVPPSIPRLPPRLTFMQVQRKETRPSVPRLRTPWYVQKINPFSTALIPKKLKELGW